jgi:Mg2+/Co2+ transporter CorB
MSFYTINQSAKLEAVADNAFHREHEIFAYDLNIENYEAILAAMPQEDWPAELVQYKDATLDLVPDDLDQVVSQYQYRDRIRFLIKTERAERAKSFAVYQALISQIPESNREQTLLQAKQRAEARIAATSAQ